MKLKLNRIKKITDISDNNITNLGKCFLSRVNNINTIKMFKVASSGLRVFRKTRYKGIGKYLFVGINTNPICYEWINKSTLINYGIYYGYSMNTYIK